MNQHLEFAWSAIDLALLLALARIAPNHDTAFLLQSMGLGSAIGLLIASSLVARARLRRLPRR